MVIALAVEHLFDESPVSLLHFFLAFEDAFRVITLM